MIAREIIQKQNKHILWKKDYMVEQDLLLDRALVSMYQDDHIRETLVFRGGTALNKLFFRFPARFSEDLDFVQLKPARIGPTIDAIKKCMQWLLDEAGQGRPRVSLGRGGTKIFYNFTNIDVTSSNIKIEINTIEHLKVAPLQEIDFSTSSDYFTGEAKVITYGLAELMATKLRAVYQRRKGRDLFDLWYVFSRDLVDIDSVVRIFHAYNTYNGITITREMFLRNMEEKRQNEDFRQDIRILLAPNTAYDFDTAFDFFMREVISRI